MRQYVTGFLFSADGQKVLLIKKAKPLWQEGKFNGLGGKIEPRETAQQAMVRELYEECGIQTKLDDWQQILLINCPTDYQVTFFYACSDQIFQAQSLENEPIEIFAVNKLPNNIIYNLQWLIPMCIEHCREKL